MAGDELKERVRTAVDIVDVIGAQLEIRPQGRNFVARCPWHDDRRPSMTVNQERQSWKCWVCDIGGDVFSFVMRRDGLDFFGALKQLAEQAGIPIDQYRRGPKTEPGQPDDVETLRTAIQSVADGYYDNLDDPRTDDARAAADYLESRGVSDHMRRTFRIGFSPDQWSWAADRLRREGFSTAVATAAGVTSDKRSGDGVVDFFRGRLMFPIVDLQGRTISMGGRVIPAIADRWGDKAGGKYVNGRETLLFRKSATLYGLTQARDAIRKRGVAMVMEGYTDVIAAHQAGIETAVAVLGTALTAEHVKLLKRFTRKVVLVLDGDAAGMKRADEVLDLFVAGDVDLRVMTLPDGEDPADFIQTRGAEAFEKLAGEAPDALEHRLNRVTENIDPATDSQAMADAADRLLRTLAAAPDGLKIDAMLRRVSDRLGFKVERLEQRLGQLRTTVDSRPRRVSESDAPSRRTGSPSQRSHYRPAVGAATAMPIDSLPPMTGLERELFLIWIAAPELAAATVPSVDAEWLTSRAGRMLLSVYQDLEMEGVELDASAVLGRTVNESLKNQFATLIERSDAPESAAAGEPDNAEQRYASLMERFEREAARVDAQRIIRDLAGVGLDDAAEDAKLAELFARQKANHKPPG